MTYLARCGFGSTISNADAWPPKPSELHNTPHNPLCSRLVSSHYSRPCLAFIVALVSSGKLRFLVNLTFLLCLTLTTSAFEQRTVDLRQHWDASLPLANPHKGWYHHYFDNGLRKYLAQRDEDLTEFPGMDHLYLRLAWSYMEPTEGRFNWKVLDDVIERWTGLGFGIALRISCKETGTNPIEQQFATPRWVHDAGAKGGYYRRDQKPGDPGFPWEPVFDDPVYLEKLEHFIAALAKRYDGKPWLRYVDVGSIGDWGEGHTSSGSKKKYGWPARMRHLEIHRRHFQKTLLMVSDDFVREAPTEEGRRKLHEYVLNNGMSYRDDSILVDYWVGRDGDTFSVANPEYFEAVYRDRPTVLEMQHLRGWANDGTWEGREGTTVARFGSNGADFFRGAIRLMHATYIGYHGDARQWLGLPGNPEISNELLNLCGYWYFPHRITFPENFKVSETNSVRIVWENRGVAPAYNRYQIVFRLKGSAASSIAMDSGNLDWLPSDELKVYPQHYLVNLPVDLPPGEYAFAFKLFSADAQRPVLLPLKSALKDENDFYTVDAVNVTR